MIHALGYSQTNFDPTQPGRLCRGRERWIEPFECEPIQLQRLTITGATFEDDSARDALRGLPESGLDVATVLAALFPRKKLLAFMEDGHPADIPDGAQGIEAYPVYRAGGRTREPGVRWHHVVSGVRDLQRILGSDPQAEQVRGFALLGTGTDLDTLVDKLFLLVGMATLDSPPARYQPAALAEVLEHTKAVIVLHRDKHGPALGIYTQTDLGLQDKLTQLCEAEGVLPVRFAIPPMLARWDRALAETRVEWMRTHDEEFPVPPAKEPSTWERRRRRRRKSESKKASEE